MDPIDEWTRAQERVISLVTDAGPDGAETVVPACPDWTVRNLLAHMVGLGADVVAGDEPDDHNEGWTQRQVDARSDASVDDLVAEWRALTKPMQKWMSDNDARPMGDAIIHEQDLRGALRTPGAQDTEALRSLREKFSDSLREEMADLPPLELRGDTWTWQSHPDAASAAVVVQASDFDLARTLMSRRSASQLREWTVVGDVEPYLEKFCALGPLPENALTESF